MYLEYSKNSQGNFIVKAFSSDQDPQKKNMGTFIIFTLFMLTMGVVACFASKHKIQRLLEEQKLFVKIYEKELDINLKANGMA